MKRFIVTGAPGAGKTAVVRQLELEGFSVVEEAATDVIAAAQTQGTAEPWRDPSFIDAIARLQRDRQIRASYPMIEKMLALRLLGMVEALKTQEQDATSRELSFLERLGLLVDQQWNWRENQVLGRRLKNAKLRNNACVEEIDFRMTRGLDKSVIRALVQESAWVGKHENVFVLGPTGVGKSFVASALAQKACRDGYSALYTRAQSLFRDLAMARAGREPSQSAGPAGSH